KVEPRKRIGQLRIAPQLGVALELPDGREDMFRSAAEQLDEKRGVAQRAVEMRAPLLDCRGATLEPEQPQLQQARLGPGTSVPVAVPDLDPRGEICGGPRLGIERSSQDDIERHHLAEQPMKAGLSPGLVRRTEKALAGTPICGARLVEPVQAP